MPRFYSSPNILAPHIRPRRAFTLPVMHTIEKPYWQKIKDSLDEHHDSNCALCKVGFFPFYYYDVFDFCAPEKGKGCLHGQQILRKILPVCFDCLTVCNLGYGPDTYQPRLPSAVDLHLQIDRYLDHIRKFRGISETEAMEELEKTRGIQEDFSDVEKWEYSVTEEFEPVLRKGLSTRTSKNYKESILSCLLRGDIKCLKQTHKFDNYFASRPWW